MLEYPPTADVPVMVIYTIIVTAVWFFAVKKPNTSLKLPLRQSRARDRIMYPLCTS